MGSRIRKYRFFADYHGAPFTNRVGNYRGGADGSCIYVVRARSISHAYALARKEVWADGPGDVGLVRRLIRRGPGGDGWERAPYLREETS